MLNVCMYLVISKMLLIKELLVCWYCIRRTIITLIRSPYVFGKSTVFLMERERERDSVVLGISKTVNLSRFFFEVKVRRIISLTERDTFV